MIPVRLWGHKSAKPLYRLHYSLISSEHAQQEGGPLESASRSWFLVMQRALLREGSIHHTNQTKQGDKSRLTLRALLAIGAFMQNGSRWLKSTDIKSTWNLLSTVVLTLCAFPHWYLA